MVLIYPETKVKHDHGIRPATAAQSSKQRPTAGNLRKPTTRHQKNNNSNATVPDGNPPPPAIEPVPVAPRKPEAFDYIKRGVRGGGAPFSFATDKVYRDGTAFAKRRGASSAPTRTSRTSKRVKCVPGVSDAHQQYSISSRHHRSPSEEHTKQGENSFAMATPTMILLL